MKKQNKTFTLVELILKIVAFANITFMFLFNLSVKDITLIEIIFLIIFEIIIFCFIFFHNRIIKKKVSPIAMVIPENAIIKCKKCGETLNALNENCSNCGSAFNYDNVIAVQNTSPVVIFDSDYYADETTILKKLLKEELKNQGESLSLLSIGNINHKKNNLLILLGICTFISIVLYFFNYSIVLSAIIEIIAFIIYLVILKKNSVLDILVEKAISKPNVELSKIIEDTKKDKVNVFIPHYLKFILVIFFAIFIPSVVFFQPKIIYTKYGDGYKVFKYTKGIINQNETVNIPSTYKGKSVIAIGEGAFKNTNIKSVVLPYGIESIKTRAFYNAKNIESIKLPSSVTEIRAEAFAYMSSLKSISLPKGLKEIRGGAFAYDINLLNIELPNTLEYIGGSAFSHCGLITEITIPSGVTEINGATFEYMVSLKTVNLHDDITYIHGEVFTGDISLNNIKLPSKITEIRGSTFENCTSLTSIEIPEGVTRIGGHAFYGCTMLSSVVVPKTVKEIGSSAFRRCYSLKSITIPRSAVVNERAFKESPTQIYYYENENWKNYDFSSIGN